MSIHKPWSIGFPVLLATMMGGHPGARAAAAGPGPSNEAVVVGEFHNQVQGKLRLKRLTCSVDDAIVYDQPTSADQVILFRLTLRPGKHTVSVGAAYDGDPDAPFAYMQGYQFDYSTSKPIDVHDGDEIRLSIIGQRASGVVEWWDRPLVSLGVFEQSKVASGG